MCVYKEAFYAIEDRFNKTDKVSNEAWEVAQADETISDPEVKAFQKAYLMGYGSAIIDMELEAAMRDK